MGFSKFGGHDVEEIASTMADGRSERLVFSEGMRNGSVEAEARSWHDAVWRRDPSSENLWDEPHCITYPLARTNTPPHTLGPNQLGNRNDQHPLGIPWTAVSTLGVVMHTRDSVLHGRLSDCFEKGLPIAGTLLGEVMPCP
jgi:hypothetical protein